MLGTRGNPRGAEQGGFVDGGRIEQEFPWGSLCAWSEWGSRRRSSTTYAPDASTLPIIQEHLECWEWAGTGTGCTGRGRSAGLQTASD